MFLHSGASLHGHEYSHKRSPSLPSPRAKRASLLKTALRPLSTPPDSIEADCSMTSSRHEPCSNRRASSGEIHHRSSVVFCHGAVLNSFGKKDASVRFREPAKDQIHGPSSASEDEESTAASDLVDGAADMSARRNKRRRLPRKSTRYAIAQPAPQHRTRQRHLLQIRPRLLLQLQEIGDRRAIPAFDLVPSHLVVGTLILPKLVKRFPRFFHANADLGQDDVLLVCRDDYAWTTTRLSALLTNDGRDAHHDKDVRAVISALPKGCSDGLAEIVMEDGSSWLASAMADGSYEFTRVDDDGETTTARWVQRSNVCTRNSLASAEPPLARSSLRDSVQDPRWTFSIIDPSSRRHPIMGSLMIDTLEVYEDYTTLSTSSGRCPRPRSSAADASGHHDVLTGSAAESRRSRRVLHEEKVLMMATASWVRLYQQGWPESSNPKCAKAMACHGRSGGRTPRAGVRRQTFPSFEENNSHAPSRADSPDSTHGSSFSKHQRQVEFPARAMSTGRAFMKRRSNRLRELEPVRGQEAPSPRYQREELVAREADRPGCLCRMRQWTSKIFHRKKEVPLSGPRH